MKYLQLAGAASVLVCIVALTGCQESSSMSCPKEDKAFFEKSIGDHLRNNPGPTGVAGFTLKEGASYNDGNHLWMVPFESDGKNLVALLSCDGRVEISGGNPRKP